MLLVTHGHHELRQHRAGLQGKLAWDADWTKAQCIQRPGLYMFVVTLGFLGCACGVVS